MGNNESAPSTHDDASIHSQSSAPSATVVEVQPAPSQPSIEIGLKTFKRNIHDLIQKYDDVTVPEIAVGYALSHYALSVEKRNPACSKKLSDEDDSISSEVEAKFTRWQEQLQSYLQEMGGTELIVNLPQDRLVGILKTECENQATEFLKIYSEKIQRMKNMQLIHLDNIDPEELLYRRELIMKKIKIFLGCALHWRDEKLETACVRAEYLMIFSPEVFMEKLKEVKHNGSRKLVITLKKNHRRGDGQLSKKITLEEDYARNLEKKIRFEQKMYGDKQFFNEHRSLLRELDYWNRVLSEELKERGFKHRTYYTMSELRHDCDVGKEFTRLGIRYGEFYNLLEVHQWEKLRRRLRSVRQRLNLAQTTTGM